MKKNELAYISEDSMVIKFRSQWDESEVTTYRVIGSPVYAKDGQTLRANFWVEIRHPRHGIYRERMSIHKWEGIGAMASELIR